MGIDYFDVLGSERRPWDERTDREASQYQLSTGTVGVYRVAAIYDRMSFQRRSRIYQNL